MSKQRKKVDWTVVITDILSSWASLASTSFWVMLFVGILHSIDDGIPAFGYWTSVLIVLILAGIANHGTLPLWNRVKSLTPDYGKKQS